MERNSLSLGLAIILLAFSNSTVLAQAPKIPRIGFLSTQSSSRSAERADAFRRGLRDLGYTEGKNIIIEYRWGDGIPNRLSSLADGLVRLKVDMIVTSGGNLSIIAAKNATSSIPIVFAGGGDAVAAGYVESFSRPGGNMTGVTLGGPELNGKRLEVLRETFPKLSRVGHVFNPKGFNSGLNQKELLSAAQALALQVYTLEIQRADEIDGAFSSAVKERVDAIVVAQNPPISSDYKRIIDLTVKHRLPAIFMDSSWTAAGGLMSYGSNISEQHRAMAKYVDKILKGGKPAILPVEQPTKYEFVINLKTAKQMGLLIPPNVLARADRVIR